MRDQLQADVTAVEARLKSILNASASPVDRLGDAMRYATMNGGKRMRAALVMGAARLASGHKNTERAERVAAAFEAMHAYSLVHDDLPAMDDADQRRGAPSCHIQFDEATAILAGDALQTLAFEILADPKTHPDAAVRVAMTGNLAAAAGLGGMAGGQMLDLQAETGAFDLDMVKTMQAMKTGALIRSATMCGGIVGEADVRLSDALSSFSRDLGLAFQIADDLLDHEGDATALGKPVGQDAGRGKGSFVTLMGVEEARDAARNLIACATESLTPWGADAEYMQSIALFAIARKS